MLAGVALTGRGIEGGGKGGVTQAVKDTKMTDARIALQKALNDK